MILGKTFLKEIKRKQKKKVSFLTGWKDLRNKVLFQSTV